MPGICVTGTISGRPDMGAVWNHRLQERVTAVLEGVRVVSLEQAVAAPLCSRRLALAGAEVIKVERPEGDFARHYDTAVAGQSAYFVWLNAGKKSVVLDLADESDKVLLLRLIGRADVFIQNLKPGALAKLGIDLERLHEQHTGLISVSISGFHPDGPGAGRKAYDLLMQAESGLADITGAPAEPGRVGVSVVDLSTGMFAYEAVLEALLARAGDGQGARINVSLFDSVAEWLAVPYLLDKYADAAPSRVGLAHPGICPYGVFTSADAKRFVLSVQNEAEWRRLCTLGLNRPDMLDDPRCGDNETRVAHRDFVDGVLQDVFGAQSYDVVDANLAAADLAYAPLNPVTALKDHADFHTQNILVNDQPVALPRVPGLHKPDELKVPQLGEHTDEIRDWLEFVSD